MTCRVRRRCERGAAPRGFTLIEMLVTLALTAMIATVLWQAMQQVARVERLLQRSGTSGQLELVRREWVRSLIRAALEEQVGAQRAFIGDGQALRLVSSESLVLPGLAGRPVRLQMQSDAASGRQRLLLVEALDGGEIRVDGPATVELMSWTGPPGRFRYLDANDVWQDQWPAPNTAADLAAAASDSDIGRAARAALPRLPRAVWVELGGEVGGSLVTEISTTSPGRGRLSQLESM